MISLGSTVREEWCLFDVSVLSFDTLLHVCTHVTESVRNSRSLFVIQYRMDRLEDATKTRVNILLYSKLSPQSLTSAYALLLARQDPWRVNDANALQNLVGHL